MTRRIEQPGIPLHASSAVIPLPPTPVDGKAFRNGKALLIGGFSRSDERETA